MATEIAVRDVFGQIGSMVNVLSCQAGNISELAPQDQQLWLLGMGNLMLGLENAEDFTMMSESQVLYSVWKCWDGLHVAVKKKWNGDFYKWAASYTKRRAGHVPAKVTIDNKITVYRDWVAEKMVKCPETVFIPNRDEFGRQVDPTLTGEKAWVEVPFDPSQIDFGKKLIARGTAKDGMMTPDAWTAMVDPFATVEDLKYEIKRAKKPEGETTVKPDVVLRNGLDFTFFEQNGVLFVGMAGTVIAFARLLVENKDSPLVCRAIEHMLSAIGIKQSTLEDNTMDMELPLVQVVDDGVIISKGCDRIGHFDRNEAGQIAGTIRNWLDGVVGKVKEDAEDF